MRVPFEQLSGEFKRVLLANGFTGERAERCARLFAETSLDGVYSHGLNRFPVFIQYIQKGHVQPNACAELKEKLGAVEQWDGNLGPGNLNAQNCMNRAMELAKINGMGCVALRNTNHWMRGGTYGWQAANAGYLSICFTNTMPNMPPWGGTQSRIGNNPLVIAMPGKNGAHLVLDMAMSLYSYGKLETYERNNQQLPFEGGYDTQGNLSKNPEEIRQTRRMLPIGYWKGSGLSLMLDLVAAVLSGGNTTADIGKLSDEYGLSQVFICFDITQQHRELTDRMTEETLAFIRDNQLAQGSKGIFYPGEQTLQTRWENLREGIPVDEQIWQQVREM